MKISPMDNRIEKFEKFSKRLFIAGAIGLTAYCGYKLHNSMIDKTNEAREIVLKYNPQKYEKMKEEGVGLYSWQYAAENIQDSLRIDSIAKTNYALGMQAVRDSLANVKNK